jgi:hypothetical protein
MCCWIEGLKEHCIPMFTADRLSMAPFHSETRRTCDIPMVIVSSKLEVTQIGRVVLRTATYKTAAIVNLTCLRGCLESRN